MAINTRVLKCAAAAAVALAATLAGCVEQVLVTPSADLYVVHAVLDADAPDQFVFLQHSGGLVSQQTGVSSATVTITTEDGRVMTADEVHDNSQFDTRAPSPQLRVAYRITPSKFGVQLEAGGRYTLQIHTPYAHDISATTTIPTGLGADGTATSIENFDRNRDTLRLSWPRVANARSYQISVRSPKGTYLAFVDSSVVLPGNMSSVEAGAVFRSGASHDVIVLAVDDHYYEYLRRTNGIWAAPQAESELTGAVGVFGAVARVKQWKVNVK